MPGALDGGGAHRAVNQHIPLPTLQNPPLVPELSSLADFPKKQRKHLNCGEISPRVLLLLFTVINFLTFLDHGIIPGI
jgi:hypothetical protein